MIDKESIPDEVKKLIDENSVHDLSITEFAYFIEKIESMGYTFDYYLDGVPVNLRKL